VLPPSNPVVSIGTCCRCPGIAEALRAKTVVGRRPIVGGAPGAGHGRRLPAAIGVETSAEAVGPPLRRPREGGLLDGWLVDTADAGATVPGVEVRAVPLLMRDLDATAAMARAALDLAGA
jgi:LPPG:FO 2-phospho-L-lactate transferase